MPKLQGRTLIANAYDVIHSLSFYYRIFALAKFRRLVIWVAGLCLIFTTSIVLASVFQWYLPVVNTAKRQSTNCYSRPIHYAWDNALENSKGHCINVDRFIISVGSVNLAINLLIFIMVGLHNPSKAAKELTLIEANSVIISPSHIYPTADNSFSHFFRCWLVRLCLNRILLSIKLKFQKYRTS